jgi:hypothetical protein
MTQRLLGTEYVDGQIRRDTIVDADGTIIEKTTFDLDPVLQDAAFYRDQDINRKAPGRLVALLPIELIEKWRIEKGIDWFKASPAERAALLNDPDNAPFRTGGGQI